jgi:hypothetical protein
LLKQTILKGYLEPISYLAFDPKIDPFRMTICSGLPSVPVGTVGEAGRIGAARGSFGAEWRYEMGSKHLSQVSFVNV